MRKLVEEIFVMSEYNYQTFISAVFSASLFFV